MLAIQTYRFLIGTKIPFLDCPGIVETFLREQGLHYERFLYYFHDDDGLPKVMKDCPHIGPLRSRTDIIGREHLYLSNIEEDTGCTEGEILRVVPKIHRRYGLSEAHILYQDIDFFGKTIPSVIQQPGNNPECIKGSGITLYRDAVFTRWNSIDLNIILHNEEETYDPAPYLEAMKGLLPGVRAMGYVTCCLTEEERALYEELNQRAIPLVEKTHGFFGERLPACSSEMDAMLEPPKLSVAPVLRRLGKRYGYSYTRRENGFFLVQKRTANGHCILLDVDVGPMFKGVGLQIRYVGAGFDHRIASTFSYPKDQADLEDCLLQVFQALADGEEEAFPALEGLYPPTPDWFPPAT